MYKQGDVELILRIKHLLYEEDYTIAGARQVLSGNGPARRTAATAPAKKLARPKARRVEQLEQDDPVPSAQLQVQGISKERYDDALEEITHLRLHLSEAESRLRRADNDRDKALNEAEQLRDTRDRTIGRLEAILQRTADQPRQD